MTQRLFVTGWLGALAAGIACTPESQSSRTQVVVEEIDAATESLSASDLSAQQEFTEVLARFQPRLHVRERAWRAEGPRGGSQVAQSGGITLHG